MTGPAPIERPDAGTSKQGAGLHEREEVIAGFWAQVIGFDGSGLDDDFFSLGGDSLAAMRLLLEIEKSFGIRLRPDIFREPTTIARLARLVGTPDETPQPDPATALEPRLRALTKDWSGEAVEPGGLVHGVNRQGVRRPWFWCLQESQEMDRIAGFLGADQPVYAMRSGHLLMAYTPEETAALAARYVREIVTADSDGPYLVGGVCQGSAIAREIAIQLQRSGRQVALLALVDTSFWDAFKGETYAGKAICFAGIRSRYNPLRRFRRPELGWRKLLPDGVRFALLPADHGDLFVGPAGAALADGLLDAYDWALDGGAAVSGMAPGALPASAYVARLEAPAAISLQAGAIGHVSVCVSNIGGVAWDAEAGIALGNHWLRPDGEVAIWADGRTPLPHAVSPNQSCEIQLTIRAPATPGSYIVEFDMVEEGVVWFKDRMSYTAFAEAQVQAGPIANLFDRVYRSMRPKVDRPARDG